MEWPQLDQAWQQTSIVKLYHSEIENTVIYRNKPYLAAYFVRKGVLFPHFPIFNGYKNKYERAKARKYLLVTSARYFLSKND